MPAYNDPLPPDVRKMNNERLVKALESHNNNPVPLADVTLAQPPAVCRWTENIDGAWELSCGGAPFCFNDEGPIANLMTYCHHCRGRIEEVKEVKEAENDK